MAHTTQDRARTASDERTRARARLEGAFEERDRCRHSYESAMGTGSELSAYMRLRHASEQVSACDKWLRWAESDDVLNAPRPTYGALDELLVVH